MSSTSSSLRTSVVCRHWRPCSIVGGGCCSHRDQPYGRRPSRGVCRNVCPLREAGNAPSGSLATYARVARRAAHATRSVAKTSLGMHRATNEQVEARLNVCRQCPGGHATWKDGDVHTCGPMLESMKGNGQGTCGCILRRKARDLAEDCPFGWWPANDRQSGPL